MYKVFKLKKSTIMANTINQRDKDNNTRFYVETQIEKNHEERQKKSIK